MMKLINALNRMSLISSCAVNPILRLCPVNDVICRYESNYESSISLKKLYPTSSLRLTTINKVPEKPGDAFNGFIPIDSLTITYSNSSGPGGQNVNNVKTKVDLRFHLETAEWLSPHLRAKMAEKHKTKISKEGYLIVRSDKTRSQHLNLADCMEILRAMILQAEFTPPPPSEESLEQLRRRREKANQNRLIEKRSKSLTKSNRQAPIP